MSAVVGGSPAGYGLPESAGFFMKKGRRQVALGQSGLQRIIRATFGLRRSIQLRTL